MTKSLAEAMTHVHIYSPYWHTLGGGEKYMAQLASALASIPATSVTLLTTEAISKESLEQYFGISLSKVGMEHVSDGTRGIARHSAGADLLVYMSNFQHIRSHARKTVLLLQIPYPRITPLRVAARLLTGELREGLKDIARHRLMFSARATVDLTIVYSRFVHDTLLRNFGIRSAILNPPIQDLLLKNMRKRNIVLSAGRFFRGLYNDKRYDILTKTFRSLSSSALKGWEYHVVGSCSNDADSTTFLKELRRANEGFPVFFHVNETHTVLRRLYNEAKIFWHAAGFGSDEDRHPERMEHFGMTTVEAMSAGCIPVVINKGGQKEIVEHGTSGFLWNTLDELADFSARIARNEIPPAPLRRQARQRFKHFSVKRFQSEAGRLFSPLLAEEP